MSVLSPAADESSGHLTCSATLGIVGLRIYNGMADLINMKQSEKKPDIKENMWSDSHLHDTPKQAKIS